MKQLQLAFKFIALAGIYLFTRSRTPPSERRHPEHSLLVLILLGNLKNTWLQNGRLIAAAESQIEILEKDILLLKAFLEDNERGSHEDAAMEDLATRVRAVIAEADALIPESQRVAAENRRRNLLQKTIEVPRELQIAAEELYDLRRKVQDIFRIASVIRSTRQL